MQHCAKHFNTHQDTILSSFLSHGEEGFFAEIRSRIRRAITEIAERQQYYLRLLDKKRALAQAENKDNAFLFRKDPTGDSGSLNNVIDHEVLAYLQSYDEPFPETGFIREILRFLQLLCEGHNTRLQAHKPSPLPLSASNFFVFSLELPANTNKQYRVL